MGRRRKHGSHLPAHVYEYNRGYYLQRPDGSRKYFRRALFRELMDEWADLYASPTHCQLLNDVFDAYFGAPEFRRLADVTKRDYLKYSERLRPVFGHCRPDGVTPKHIKQYQKMRAQAAPVQANRELSLLKTVYTYAMGEGWASDNPATYVRRIKETPRDRYVTDEEFRVVYALAPEWIKVAMTLTAITGVPEGDLVKLRRGDFQEDGLHYQRGKTKKKIHIMWSDGLRWCYDTATALHKTSNIYLFPNRSGKPYTPDGFRTQWHKVMKKALAAGLAERFTFHDLRAKAGTDGSDWWLLGHSDRKLFERVYNRKARPARPVK